ncbi:glycosyltransferase [Shimia sagamensis]|uniref:Galactosyltransferase n=1 Tax=Shimia sagamensis TaxID=1566352 RepID=A0ABY1NB54_9RHOB|nr:glycosyltransferase [Shimia sagamensis]SMP05464.1 Galactosyltransferase [Shimia sagamensis]
MPALSSRKSQQKTPAISVIVPVFNVSDHVVACLHSIQAQSWTDFEVIVVDDGSTDESGSLAAAFCETDARFHFVTQPNKGLSGARNTGLDLAKAEVISFVDSDDRIAPEFLEALYSVLETTNGDWVACAVKSCHADGNYSVHSAIHDASAFHESSVPRRYPFEEWQQVVRHFPSAWNKLYRRSLIDGLRFDEGTWFEDHSFFERAAAQTDHLLHLPRPLYWQTQGREGQITTSDSDRVFEQMDVLRRLRGIMELGPFDGAGEAYEQIASRLLFERSLSLRHPARRARFAAESAQFLQREGLTYATDWDSDTALSWGVEMAGDLPLSVCIECSSTPSADLQTTLDSLAQLIGPGLEVVLLCRSTPVAQTLEKLHPNLRVLDLGRLLPERLWLEIRGRFVCILRPGVELKPASLFQMVELMLRQDAQVGLTAYATPSHCSDTAPGYCTGFSDLGAFSNQPLVKGLLSMDGVAALSLLPELSARMFDRSFLINHKLTLTKSPRTGWALQIGAAVLAPRVVYEPWAGMSISFPAPDNEPVSVIGKEHDALVRALPDAAKHRLPKGWQRRLFGRAFQREQSLRGGRKALQKDIGLVWAAARRGLLGNTPKEASFDHPHVISLEKIFDPVGRLARSFGRPRSRSLLTQQKQLDARVDVLRARDENSTLWFFPAASHSVFTCIADFSQKAYANLNFLAADGLTVPVHFSFRPEECCIVFNHQDNDGWGKERSWPFAFAASILTVRIVIEAHTVHLVLDGQEFCTVTVDTQFHKPDAEGLGLTLIEPQGDIRPLEILPKPPVSDLSLDPRLTLQAAHASDGLHIRDLTSGSLLPVTALESLPQQPGVRALLPARLWTTLPEGTDASLHLQLENIDGHPVGAPLVLSQVDLVGHIKTLLARELSCADTTLVLTVLEHIVHARLYPLLNRSEQNTVQTLASHFGLDAFLLGADTGVGLGQGAPLTSINPAAGPDPITREIDAALAELAANLADNSGKPPLEIVAHLPVSAFAVQHVYLTLGEFFARDDQDFASFFALAKSAGVRSFVPIGQSWHDSVVLPFLFLQGDMEALLATFRSLVKPRQDWISTTSIAWVVRQALRSQTMSSRHRAHLLFLFEAFISRRTPNYWERAHCRELTLAAVDLAGQHDVLPERQRRRVLHFCARNYGLSRLFWELLTDRNDAPMASELQTAKTQYDKIQSHAHDPQAAHVALMFFDNVNCPDAPRVRREVFGSAGVPLPQNTSLDLATLQQAHKDPALAALRFMAAPGAATPEASLAELVAHRGPQLLQNLSRAPFPTEQRTVAADIARVLSNPEEVVDPENLESLLRRCGVLGDRRSHFLGIALGVILITCFGRTRQNQPHVATVVHWVRTQIASLGQADQQAIMFSTPVQMTLAALLRSGHSQDVAHELERLLLGGAKGKTLPVPAKEGALSGSPLYDTIVTVFSCKPYLNSRIPVLRDGWLRLLQALGVPYVVIVGDGDGQRHGDVLHLDAPDDYEGLPLKTLAAIEWVHNSTDFAHMVKVDDDCFFNAPLFFQSLNYRKFDYYGRRLTRGVGQLDRIWHQQKSTTQRGRMDLDKSPEPSTYADGGSGYALSRKAMSAALIAAQTSAGQQLIQVSFMEDKLLGDLLAMSGISVVDEDYSVTVRRRAHGDGIPVPSWQNGFNSSKSAPVHLVHMDTTDGQQEAVARLNKFELTPKKIWPSYQKVRLGYQSNALELVSPEARLHEARHAEVALVACMRNEMFMLPQFLKHYRKLGVGAFLIADNASDDGTLEYLAEQPDVSVFSVDTDYKLSHYGVAWQQALLAEYRVDKWSIVADADELLVWQENQTQTLPELLSEPDFAKAEAVRLFMLDMYPKGPLEDARFTGNPFDEAGYCDRVPFLSNLPVFGPFSDRPTWTSALRHRLIPGSRPNLFVAQKLALMRYQPWMRLSAGLHYVGDARLADRELIFAHFKYNADFRRKAQTEVARRQHFNDAEEYQKYLALASEGRSVIYDPDLSAHWADTPFAQKIFGSQTTPK